MPSIFEYISGMAAGGMPRSPLMKRPLVRPQRSLREIIEERPRFEGNNPRFNIPAPAPDLTSARPVPGAPGLMQIGPENIPPPAPVIKERGIGIPFQMNQEPRLAGNIPGFGDVFSVKTGVSGTSNYVDASGNPLPREITSEWGRGKHGELFMPQEYKTPPTQSPYPVPPAPSLPSTIPFDRPSKAPIGPSDRPSVPPGVPVGIPVGRPPIPPRIGTPPPPFDPNLGQPPPMRPPVMQPPGPRSMFGPSMGGSNLPGRIPGGHPIRIPEPVGPMPGMPPLTPMPQTPMSSPVIPQVAQNTGEVIAPARTTEEKIQDLIKKVGPEKAEEILKKSGYYDTPSPVPEAVPLSIEEKRNWGVRQPRTVPEMTPEMLAILKSMPEVEGEGIPPQPDEMPGMPTPTPPGLPTPPGPGTPPGMPKSNYTIAEWYNMSPEEQKAARDEQVGRWWTPPDTILGYNDAPLRVEDIPRLEAMGGHEDLLARLYTIRDQIGAWKSGSPVTPTGPDPTGPGMPTPPGPGMPPTPPGPVASQGTGTSPTPEPPMPPDVSPVGSGQPAQPTKEEFMERLMQMIQALQERSQPAPQAAPQAAPPQQWAPPQSRPPVAAFNMGNASAPMAAPTMPQMFNSGPGFFTPQQRGPLINQDMLGSNQNQIPMPSSSPYGLDFSSFLRKT